MVIITYTNYGIGTSIKEKGSKSNRIDGDL